MNEEEAKQAVEATEEQFEIMVDAFLVGIKNAYLSKEERREQATISFRTGDGIIDLKDDFAAMLQAMYVFYVQLTKKDINIIEFAQMITRFVIYKRIQEATKESKKDNDKEN